ADPLAQVGRPHRGRLLDQRDEEERPGGERQVTVGGAVHGTVDESPHDLRVEELEPDAGHEKQRKRADLPPLWEGAEPLPQLAPLPRALLPDCSAHSPPPTRRLSTALSERTAAPSSLSLQVARTPSAARHRQ